MTCVCVCVCVFKDPQISNISNHDEEQEIFSEFTVQICLPGYAA
jgi:hypothetical protein